ncbi:hypothetical protein DFH28DRAFT_1152427 [Melampsora americana]|nr:hypothetical protein DFH28DRAFT_1152427 [Melampsora americana]
MPKVIKSRHSHPTTTPISIINRQFSQPETHCEKLVEREDVEHISANTILKELDNSKAFISNHERVLLPLDEKRQRRLEGMRQAPKPYSKSHQKRLKKKAKEIGQIGNLESVKNALNEVSKQVIETPSDLSIPNQIKSTLNSKHQLSIKASDGKNGKSPNEKQRAKLLDEETSRLPRILNHPEFKLDAFSALRTHIKNSLKS